MKVEDFAFELLEFGHVCGDAAESVDFPGLIAEREFDKVVYTIFGGKIVYDAKRPSAQLPSLPAERSPSRVLREPMKAS